MNFHSWTFGFFFIAVYLLYLSLPWKRQNRLLLIASYIFYGYWDWHFLFLIFISTVTDYVCGRKIATASLPFQRKIYLAASLFINLALLCFFKYFYFLCDNIRLLLSLAGIHFQPPDWNIILPVGISFYTFQTLSYTIDIYRGQMKPTRNFWDYALYVSFFPQLLAGPIERATRLLPQIQRTRRLDAEQVTEGAFLIYWGLFKKLFIADNLGTLLYLFANPSTLGNTDGDGGIILFSGYAFLFQLYCDFSAYSDIARGLAKVMGFELMENFKMPLLASNIQETWSRWHISLTTWMRDYVYYPLAVVRVRGKHLNNKVLIIIVFLVVGLWHGAAWNFVLWGGFHGLLLAGYASIKPKLAPYRIKNKCWISMCLRLLSILFTFHLSMYGALLFRADSLTQILTWSTQIFSDFAWSSLTIQLLMKMIFFTAPLLLVEILWYYHQDLKRLFHYPAILRYAYLYITFYLLVIYCSKAPTNFIYFQF